MRAAKVRVRQHYNLSNGLLPPRGRTTLVDEPHLPFPHLSTRPPRPGPAHLYPVHAQALDPPATGGRGVGRLPVVQIGPAAAPVPRLSPSALRNRQTISPISAL